MSKADEFVREMHADLAPLGDDDGKLDQRAGVALSEVEMRQAEELAAASKMNISKLFRASLRRTLRDARKAGLLEPVKA